MLLNPHYYSPRLIFSMSRPFVKVLFSYVLLGFPLTGFYGRSHSHVLPIVEMVRVSSGILFLKNPPSQSFSVACMSEALNIAVAKPALRASGPVAWAFMVGRRGGVWGSLPASLPVLFPNTLATSISKKPCEHQPRPVSSAPGTMPGNRGNPGPPGASLHSQND